MGGARIEINILLPYFVQLPPHPHQRRSIASDALSEKIGARRSDPGAWVGADHGPEHAVVAGSDVVEADLDLVQFGRDEPALSAEGGEQAHVESRRGAGSANHVRLVADEDPVTGVRVGMGGDVWNHPHSRLDGSELPIWDREQLGKAASSPMAIRLLRIVVPDFLAEFGPLTFHVLFVVGLSRLEQLRTAAADDVWG
jgi:hypothetical protein